MSEPRIQLLDDLGSEFRRVGREHERRPRRFRSGVRRTPLLVGLLSLALASGAVALDVLPVGTKLPTESVRGPGEPQFTSQRTVVGNGSLPNAGKWQMTVVQSNAGACLGLQLLDSLSRVLTEPCNGLNRLDVASVGGGDELPAHRILFGPAPEAATAVRVTAPSGFTRTVETYSGPSDMPGDFYVLEVPRDGLDNARVQWVDEDGNANGAGVDVPGTNL